MASIAEKQKIKILGLLRDSKASHEKVAQRVGCSPVEVRDYAIDLLMERAVFTRAVCREVREDKGSDYSRARTALKLLQHWSQENLGYSYPRYCQEEITAAAADCKALMQEIQDGQRVCSALSLLGTADSASEDRDDCDHFRASITVYWTDHRRATPRPPREVITV